MGSRGIRGLINHREQGCTDGLTRRGGACGRYGFGCLSFFTYLLWIHVNVAA